MSDEETVVGESAPASVPVPVTIGRRGFLQRAAISGLGVAALGGLGIGVFEREASAETSGSATSAAHQWAMVIDLRRCDGCKVCTTACQSAHFLHEDQTWIKVFTMTSASGATYFMPRPCMMCEDPPCVTACPVNANIRTPEGLTLVDQSKCLGTRVCMNACPYEARYFNWSALFGHTGSQPCGDRGDDADGDSGRRAGGHPCCHSGNPLSEGTGSGIQARQRDRSRVCRDSARDPRCDPGNPHRHRRASQPALMMIHERSQVNSEKEKLNR